MKKDMWGIVIRVIGLILIIWPIVGTIIAMLWNYVPIGIWLPMVIGALLIVIGSQFDEVAE